MASSSDEVTVEIPRLPHPPTSEMINSAITALKQKRGSSTQAIKKYLTEHYNVDVKRLNPYIKKYLTSASDSGVLIRTSGTGAQGSFKMATTKLAKKAKPAAAKKIPPAEEGLSTKPPKVPKPVKPKISQTKSLGSKKSLPRLSVGKKSLTLKKPKSKKKSATAVAKSLTTLPHQNSPIKSEKVKAKTTAASENKTKPASVSEDKIKPSTSASENKTKTVKKSKKKANV